MLRLFLIVLVFIPLAPGWALAQTCSFGVTNINFGNVDTLAGSAVDTTGTLNINCTGLVGTTIRICPNLSAGTGGATSGTRHMLNATNQALNYSLFQDSARTIPWGSVQQPALGDPPPIDVTIGLTGSVSTSRTIFARVFGNQQSAATGLYTSTFSGSEVGFNYSPYLLNPPACSSVIQNTTRPSFTAQANVMPNCLVTAQNIDFGNHGILDADIDGVGGLGVICSQGTAYTVGLDNGLNGDSPTNRRMILGSEAVIYGLFKDAARSQPWGSSGGELVTGTGAGATQNLPVYGRVSPQATPPAGTYTDTVVVTVTY